MSEIETKDVQEQLEEFKLQIALSVDGVTYEDGLFDDLDSNEYEIYDKPSWDPVTKTFKKFNQPAYGELDHGLHAMLSRYQEGKYEIRKDGTGYAIYDQDKRVSGLKVKKRAEFAKKTTEDGTLMRDIAMDSSYGSDDKSIVVAYSEECSVKDKGETCLFCCFNRKRAPEDQPLWKNPKQIAETAKAAYDEGFQHLTITGGFIPERREVEYYLDVAEQLQDTLGVENFHGTACIGAPLDLSIIEKYKEAGYETIAFNTEVWRKEWFNVYCAGKVTECGGYDHWLEAIKYAVEVFGKGKVRSQFVAGLQPKEVLLDGIETLADWGVVAIASPWRPGIGSPLEGHRSPYVDWHYDVLLKTAEILHNNGITATDIFYACPDRKFEQDLFKILYNDVPVKYNK